MNLNDMNHLKLVTKVTDIAYGPFEGVYKSPEDNRREESNGEKENGPEL